MTLHTLGTLLLLGAFIRMVVREPGLRHPGGAHIASSYLWMLVPTIVAPFIVAKASESFPVDEVSGNGGPILIYGWILTFILAVIPYFFTQVFQPNRAPALGGSWWTLASMHLGSLLFWLGLFLPSVQAGLRAGAFFLWFAALLPMLLELYAHVKAGTERMERASRRIVPADSVQMD